MSRKQDKLKEIDEFLEQLEPVIPSSFEEYEKDYKARAICERLFEKIIEAVVDIAHIIIRELKLPPATEDTNAFEVLAEKGVISEELAKKLKHAKGMRNIIAHEYGEINDELVFEAVSEELERDVREFIRVVKRFKMKIKVEIKKGKDVPKEIFNFINNQRIKEYGKEANLFEKKDHKDSILFFIKDKKEIVSFGLLRNIEINYLEKKYKINGIGGILSLKKKKGYGKILIQAMINYLKKKGKTGLGFCARKNLKFYKKSGLKIKKRFGLRFALRNPKTGEIKFEPKDDIGDGIYYERKDKLVSKILKTKSTGYYWLPDLKEPHW